jgi:hypothetical protein
MSAGGVIHAGTLERENGLWNWAAWISWCEYGGFPPLSNTRFPREAIIDPLLFRVSQYTLPLDILVKKLAGISFEKIYSGEAGLQFQSNWNNVAMNCARDAYRKFRSHRVAANGGAHGQSRHLRIV